MGNRIVNANPEKDSAELKNSPIGFVSPRFLNRLRMLKPREIFFPHEFAEK